MSILASTLLTLTVFPFTLTTAQQTPQILLFHPQPDTWNSNLNSTSLNLTGTGINNTNQTANIVTTLNFERSNWALSSVAHDDFYTFIPSNSSTLPPGSILKIQALTNTTDYTLPPNVALSRILYTTQNLRNETIPASAYILWPYLPLSTTEYPNLSNANPSLNSSRFPVIAWAHGTSGIFSECGPFHIRNLWYQYSAPFTAALAGYVVVGVDYQGLGVNTTADGASITHLYLAAPAAANDLIYAVQAAQSAFSTKLSKEFVVIGHSQGGGAAWGAAIREATNPTPGYLGTIAGSPTTNLTGEIALLADAVPPTLGVFWAEAIRNLYSAFNQSRILTDEGLARLRLARELEMSSSAIGALLSDFPGTDNGTILRKGWNAIPEIIEYLSLCDVGTQRIKEPMLVLQGTEDPAVPYVFTDASVATTCTVMGNNTGWGGIEYARFDGVSHVPVLFAGQRVWLAWLAERFGGVGKEGNGNGSGEVNV